MGSRHGALAPGTVKPAAETRPERRRKLLIAITLAEIGGAQTCVAQLLPGLSPDFDVVVAAHGPGPLRAAAAEAGARWIELRQVRRPIGPRDLLGFVELVRVIRRERPAIVHAHSSKAGVLARLAAALCRTPVIVFTAHGWAFKAEPGPRSWLYLWADRLAARISSAVVCVSETERREGLAAGTCRADRTLVIRNAVDTTGLPRRRHGERGRPLLVSVGRLKAPKDFDTLLEALGLLDAVDYSALIVGDGPERAELEATAGRLGLLERVVFAGERDDVGAILASILEAMAAELPVVASSVGGVPELVHDGVNGLTVPPHDASALADALRRVLSDHELRRTFGAAGRARAEREFALDRFRSAHVDLYRALLDGSRLQSPARQALDRMGG